MLLLTLRWKEPSATLDLSQHHQGLDLWRQVLRVPCLGFATDLHRAGHLGSGTV